MPNNILIGVGGTGAKIVESALMFCAAGLGPPTLQVGFVDQDEDNGNVARARALLKSFVAFQEAWDGTEDRPYLDRQSRQAGCSALMRTRVEPVSTEDLWCPHPERSSGNDRFANIFRKTNLPKEQQTLMDLLFLEDDQNLRLDKGYKGRPHIGSPAIAAATLNKATAGEPGGASRNTDLFWRKVTEALEGSRGGEELRIFVAGSVFGGTGAAGFPTLARVLQANANAPGRDGAPGRQTNLKLGGLLMLPYFSFPPPGAGQDTDVARDEELMLQSQAALDYYAGLFRSGEKLFDELYVLGWPDRLRLGYHEAGKKAQANPPLAPELIAATSAIRFMTAQTIDRTRDNPVYVCARETSSAVQWNDVPLSEARTRMSQLLRFAAYWRFQFNAEVSDNSRGILGLGGGRSKHPWFKAQNAKEIAFETSPVVGASNALNALLLQILNWASVLQAATISGGLQDFRLWDLRALSRTFDPKDPASGGMRDDVSGLDLVAQFNGIVPLGTRDQAAVRTEIGTLPMSGQHVGIGKLVAAVHHAARVED